MKKIVSGFCLLIGLCIAFSACSKSETYADKVKKERKIINRFISENNIKLLYSYPKNHKFAENEFYVDISGVYINVVDSGNGKRANASNFAEVSYRFWDTKVLYTGSKADTLVVTNDVGGQQPVTFEYGRETTYQSANSESYAYSYLSPGVVAPLKYVGENAIVRLIVPFTAGSTYQMQTYLPIYYGKVKYTKIVN